MTTRRPARPSRWSTAARSLSRRTALAAAAGGIAGGLLPTGSLLPRGIQTAERETLEGVFAVELLLAFIYRLGLERFDAAAWVAAGWPDELHADLAAIEAQEREHSVSLADAFGGGGVLHTPAVEVADPAAFLDVLLAAENLAVAAYAGAAADVNNRRLRRALLGIHSVEARHAAYLAGRLGRPAFPDAIDRPQGSAAVLAAVARFGPSAGSAATPSPATPVASDPGAHNRRFRELRDDAAARLGVPLGEVSVSRVEERTWPDAALGCPVPGGVYAQVVTAGYLVVVAAVGGENLEYHTDDRGNFVSC